MAKDNTPWLCNSGAQLFQFIEELWISRKLIYFEKKQEKCINDSVSIFHYYICIYYNILEYLCDMNQNSCFKTQFLLPSQPFFPYSEAHFKWLGDCDE